MQGRGRARKQQPSRQHQSADNNRNPRTGHKSGRVDSSSSSNNINGCNRNGGGGKQRSSSYSRNHRNNGGNHNNNHGGSGNGELTSIRYDPHKSYDECLHRYTSQHMNYTNVCGKTNVLLPTLVRGKLRALPGNNDQIPAFISCDHGHYTKDILIANSRERNRAMDGDLVFVQVLGPVGEESSRGNNNQKIKTDSSKDGGGDEDEGGDTILMHSGQTSDHQERMNENTQEETTPRTWQDDEDQMRLWNPQVSIPRTDPLQREPLSSTKENQPQYKGRVLCIVPPRRFGSEIPAGGGENGGGEGAVDSMQGNPELRIVGSLKLLQSGTTLLTPLNRSLPQFLCPPDFAKQIKLQVSNSNNGSGDEENTGADDGKEAAERVLYQATYTFGDWQETHKWPPCRNVQKLGESCLVEDEILALLVENKVDHGDHPAQVLQDVEASVQSGLYETEDGDMGWKPTPNMYKGRRDYREQRIFTIDPTTAKDLDDALHITLLPELNQVEIGVHIADVSYFCKPHTPVDREAQRRATTVYLVDRTIPMLPRSLCEVACSLNENTERLAFSCVWRMNLDGTMPTSKKESDSQIWYGRSVIKSCARLDYATAQNIIDGKIGDLQHQGDDETVDEEIWPTSRRPSGGHTMAQVAEDVRLLHKVAMARRKRRFDNGALALNGIKLTFQLDKDGQTPLLAAPYPIRDSNRLVEEYMLLANYLVAQRLISHAKDRALLRHHPEPLEEGLDKVADVAMAAMGFEIDIRTSQTLQDSLCRLKHECSDPLVMMSITQMLMTPMQPADYFAAGTVPSERWKHFALNIPYYTHFTSPIRRYPDVIVHRLLQATLDDSDDKFELSADAINVICTHCNEKRMASKQAQERCDRVFLALYVRAHPLSGEMGVVLSVGVSSFTVFVPSLGVSALLYLEEHKDMLTFKSSGEKEGEADGEDGLWTAGPTIVLENKTTGSHGSCSSWTNLEIRIFVKIQVTVYCRDKPPIDIKMKLEGPWRSGPSG